MTILIGILIIFRECILNLHQNPFSIKVRMNIKREQQKELLLLHHLYRKGRLWKKQHQFVLLLCFIICLSLEKSSRPHIIIGFKNHFSAYTKNRWKIKAIYCLFPIFNWINSYNPSVFLQHFFQKAEECKWIPLIPKPNLYIFAFFIPSCILQLLLP